MISSLTRSLSYVESFPTGTFEVLVRNLESPRGLSCAPPGDPALVYVAEAGKGGSTENEFYIAADGRPAFIGKTGAVGRINPDLSYDRVVEGLPSSAAFDEGGGFLDANGPNDVAFFDNGKMAIVMGLASNADIRDGLTTSTATKFGTLLDEDGDIIADLAEFERANNSDGRKIPEGCGLQSFVDDHTSNPFRARSGQAIQVVDPGANSVLEVEASGLITVVASNFPDQMQTMPDLSAIFPGGQDSCPPDGPGLPPAGPIPSQPVPTSISCPVEGSDDGCLVGELTGLPFATGSANVYDISTGAVEYPTNQSGFTTVVDLAHASNGDLYVVEYARKGLAGVFGVVPPLGGLYRIGGGVKQQLDGGSLTGPNGVAICGDNLYLTDRTRNAGEGRVLRMKLD